MMNLQIGLAKSAIPYEGGDFQAVIDESREWLQKSPDDISVPFRAPQANTYAERWIRSARQECLDHILILNERHLHHVLKEYVAFYNASRPHQGINQQTPIPIMRPIRTGSVARRDVLGGIVNDYYRLAA